MLNGDAVRSYYVAEGVRIYSQKSWRDITGDQGKSLIEQYIGETVRYYISQTEAENHAVREAACACIAELGAKVSFPLLWVVVHNHHVLLTAGIFRLFPVHWNLILYNCSVRLIPASRTKAGRSAMVRV